MFWNKILKNFGFVLLLLHKLLHFSITSISFHFSAYLPGRGQKYSINSSKCGQCYKHRYDPSHEAIQAVGKCLQKQQNNTDYAAVWCIVKDKSKKILTPTFNASWGSIHASANLLLSLTLLMSKQNKNNHYPLPQPLPLNPGPHQWRVLCRKQHLSWHTRQLLACRRWR